MKGLPERMNWRRFPTTGERGGPGGRLSDLDLDLRVKKRMEADRRNAANVNMT